jgi:hypothetical protein
MSLVKRLLPFLFLIIFVLIRAHLANNLGFSDKEDLIIYRAWSLVHFQIDEFGRYLPFVFSSSDGAQLPFLSYLTTPMVYLLGISFSAQIVVDNIYWILPLVVCLMMGYGRWVGIMLIFNPVFFWPGKWEEKLVTAISLILWKLLNRKKLEWIAVSIVVLLMIIISFDAWLVLPVILLASVVYRRQRNFDWRRLLIMGGVLMMIFFGLIKSQASLGQYFSRNYLGIFSDIGITNSINSLRGEDYQFGIKPLGRLLHNKSQVLSVYVSQSLSYLNPSFLFITGDDDETSNSLWVSPFLTISAGFIIYVLFFSRSQKGGLIAWCLGVTLMLGLARFPQEEKRVYLLSIPIILLIMEGAKEIPKKWFRAIGLLGIVNLLVLVNLSISLKSAYQLRCARQFFDQVVSLSKDNQDRSILISDDICSNPGPGLAMIMAMKPKTQIDNTFGWKYLRQIGNIIVVSPADEAMTTILLEEKIQGQLFIRLVSKNMMASPMIYSKNKSVLLKTKPFYSNLIGDELVWKKDEYETVNF